MDRRNDETSWVMEGIIMIFNTQLRFDHRRSCRLIGHDLYSASADEPLEEQEYAAEKTAVIETERRKAGSRAYVDRPDGTNPPGGESVTRNLDLRKETSLLWLHETP